MVRNFYLDSLGTLDFHGLPMSLVAGRTGLHLRSTLSMFNEFDICIATG